MSQEQLEKMVKAEDYGQHFRISDFVALVVTSLFISPLVPAVLPLTFLGLGALLTTGRTSTSFSESAKASSSHPERSHSEF